MAEPWEHALTRELYDAFPPDQRPRPPAERGLAPRPFLRAESAVLVQGTHLVLLVPFREDFSGRRTPQLFRLLRHLNSEFLPHLPSEYEVTLLVLEQSAYGPFNKGKLLNAGARWCQRFLRPPVLLVIQDVDMLPSLELMPFYCHHRQGDAVHPGWINRKYDYEDFFGSVCTMTLGDYASAGGCPNEFWGWGKEDDCLYWRLRFCGRCEILKPSVSGGLEHLDDPKEWIDGRGVEHNPLRELEPEHMLAARDTLFDPPDFRVIRRAREGRTEHLLLELRRQGSATGYNSPLYRPGILSWLSGSAGDFEAVD